MSLATWHALHMDATDAGLLAGFWSAALGRPHALLPDGGYRLDSEGDSAGLWIDPVPEPKSVKHRIHLDVDVGSVDGLRSLGAAGLREPTDEDNWWIMADPEGGEFCAFPRDGRPPMPGRLYEVVVDCADPHAQADWWGRVFGIPREGEPQQHYAALESDGKLPFDFLCFVPVPEPKVGKNRIHWDVVCSEVDELVAAGATVLRTPDDEVFWHVLADPEGNEFCATTRGMRQDERQEDV
ncbi:hypothetical protein G1H11_09545 [Phytoactinopolyspora alkaliphila]|uniref:Glyoxalase-like domain-containing protein n=1 Tax=Phytoactinopolyspora alkaliphila TaxID=1783498 RepID=A0A6N9YKW1_9ACTN|nr:VOC family protein [Phytoactinopolyspora alkaliphila]NED95557.1 hypothetical protein [Phytoactinopolyspora alkaliphila]